MDKKEPYQPSAEEVQKAEDMMTDEQSSDTHSREVLMRNNSLQFSIKDIELGMKIIFDLKELGAPYSSTSSLHDIANKLDVESHQKRTEDNQVNKYINGFHMGDDGKPYANIRESGGPYGFAVMEDSSIELTKPQAGELLEVIERSLQNRKAILEREKQAISSKMEAEGVVDDSSPTPADSDRARLHVNRGNLDSVNLRLDVIANAREKLEKLEG